VRSSWRTEGDLAGLYAKRERHAPRDAVRHRFRGHRRALDFEHGLYHDGAAERTRAKAGPKNGAIASRHRRHRSAGGHQRHHRLGAGRPGPPTVCAQVVADVLGPGTEDVVVNVEFDTQKDAWSVAAGNYSSRFAGAVAGTVHLAANKMRDKLARIAAAAS
jgi:2-furoyl-CoA dehydrogenase large subunit